MSTEFEAIQTPLSEVIRSRWLQTPYNTQLSDTFEVGKLYFKLDSYLHNFRGSVIFSNISLYTQAVPYTTYVQSSKRQISSLGSL